jgi:hypothetical protein
MDQYSEGQIERSSDGGKTWSYITLANSIGGINSVSALNHDTIYASGITDKNLILRSTNAGYSWDIVPMQLDTNYSVTIADGIALTSDGHPIAIFEDGISYIGPSKIFRLESDQEAISSDAPEFTAPTANPNPISTFTTISIHASASSDAEVRLVNMLGIEVANVFAGHIAMGETQILWQRPPTVSAGAYQCLVKIGNEVKILPLVIQ